MKVYMVITKFFYKVNGFDYQKADALEPITVYSSEVKANNAMKDREEILKNHGYKRTSTYNNLLPVEHFTMINEHNDLRAVTYKLKEEVE